jgi:hypothetical protein
MLKRPALALALGAIFAGIFLASVLHLFALRYAAGDAYPPYSTLRADPLGTKAIYEALGELPGRQVQRNFRTLPRMQTEGPVTLIYAGVKRHVYWAPEELAAFEKLVRGGSRAVFTFFPIDRPPSAYEETREERKERERKQEADQKDAETSGKKPRDEKEKKEEKEDAEELLDFDTVAKGWGFHFKYLPPAAGKTFTRKAIATEAAGAGEKEISWHSALYFDELAPEWTILYTSDEKPVVIERKLGEGTLVLAGDSFFLSNEALRHERRPQLLGRILSGPAATIFDEEHHGIREEPGIASLARKYRLHGAVAALALLAALYVWKNAARFLPPRDESAGDDDIVTGKEAAEGFVNLLRRTIKPAALLEVCVDEWRKTSAHPSRERARLEEAWASEQARPPKEHNPLAAYRTLSAALARSSTRRPSNLEPRKPAS